MAPKFPSVLCCHRFRVSRPTHIPIALRCHQLLRNCPFGVLITYERGLECFSTIVRGSLIYNANISRLELSQVSRAVMTLVILFLFSPFCCRAIEPRILSSYCELIIGYDDRIFLFIRSSTGERRL